MQSKSHVCSGFISSELDGLLVKCVCGVGLVEQGHKDLSWGCNCYVKGYFVHTALVLKFVSVRFIWMFLYQFDTTDFSVLGITQG